ncbi:AMP-binding protein [Colwellia demingiae]|uniref:Long-chain-fatty-acid--CoA ligase n=1 Tax=Colwellia demingiae TaxID=89401 RepID=A0A5C6QHE3_9GAMM|nr:AMP-binding protein [Colwellia demingiae]TWX68077.1 AMP-binding protein [Colwellia demingiae]
MEKVWLKSYPPGVPEEINPEQYKSLVTLFDKSTKKYADNIAFINMGTNLSYGDLAEQSRDFAAYLQQNMGLQKGDKFAIMVPNVLQYPIALFGALKAGLTVVNVNPLYTARELEHQLKDSKAKAMLVVENFAVTLESVIANTSVEHVITTQLGDRAGFLKGKMINTAVKHIKKMVPNFSLPDCIKFNTVLKQGKKLSFQEVDVFPEDLAFLQYTGGTTGVAKGAMLSHRNIVANMLQMNAMVKPLTVENKELVVTALPLYHIFALTCNCLSFMTFGGANLLITNPRDLPMFIKTMSKYPITAFAGLNTLFNGLLNEPDFLKLDFSTLKLTFAGGMATQKSVADKWHDVTGSPVLEGYGLTECSPCVTTSPYDQTSFSGAIGVPLPSTSVKLLDDEGNEVALNEPGEMWIRGPQVMQGYYNLPEATAEVIIDDWVATGDVATVDENGFFTIVDRKKDMILVSGFNVFPNEIEEVISMIDDIIEVAVIGIPCEQSGEKIKVFLVTKSGELNKKALIEHCRLQLTSYKIPKEFELRDELPKSNVGKILRKDLRS